MVHEFKINGGPIPKHVEDAVMSFDRHPYLRNINLSQSATLRQLKQQVKVSLDELASFRQNVAGLREGVTDFSKYFGFRISPNSSLGVLHKLVALEAIITNTGPLRMAWFEPTRRDELLALKASCREDIQVCNDITTRRNGVWASAAFEKSGNDIAQRAIEFEPFWRRLLAMINGRWRQFGEEYRELYRSQPPKSAVAVLDDLLLLRDYHRRTARARESVARFQKDLVYDAQGQPNWEALHSGLDVVGRLQSLIKIPDELKQHLCSDTGINRVALHNSAILIGEKLRPLDEQAAQASTHFSLAQLGERRVDYKSYSSSELESELRAAEDALADFQKSLAELEFRLVAGSDIAIDSMPEAFLRLHSLLEQRQTIAGIRSALADAAGTNGPLITPRGVSAQDVAAANATLELVRKYSVRPGIQAIRIVSDATVREQVRHAAAATENILGDLDELWANLGQLFRTNKPVSSGVVLEQLSIQDLAAWCQGLSTQINSLEQWVELHSIKAELEKHGLSSIFNEVLDNSLTTAEVVDIFRAKFYRQWLDAVYANDPILSKFQVDAHKPSSMSFETWTAIPLTALTNASE